MSDRPQWECESPTERGSGEDARATERAGDERRDYVEVRRERHHHHEEDEELVVEEGAALVDSEDDVPQHHTDHEAEEGTRLDPEPEGALWCGCRGRCTCGCHDGSAFRDVVQGLVGETVSIVVSETTFSGRLASAGSSFITLVRNRGGGSSLDIAYVPIRQILGVRV